MRCYMAVLRGALGEHADAFKEIERALDENSAFLYSIDVDPKMDTFRSDRRFTKLQDSIKVEDVRGEAMTRASVMASLAAFVIIQAEFIGTGNEDPDDTVG